MLQMHSETKLQELVLTVQSATAGHVAPMRPFVCMCVFSGNGHEVFLRVCDVSRQGVLHQGCGLFVSFCGRPRDRFDRLAS